MKNRELVFWGLIEEAPFLRNYLTQIESKTETENVVEELVAFYRDVDVLIDDINLQFSDHLKKSSVISYQLSESVK